MKKCIILFFPLAAAAADPIVLPPGCDEYVYPLQKAIVYTSSPRDLAPLPPYDDRTLWQDPSDVARITLGFEESDLEIKHPDNSVEVIHNCTNSPVQCAAQEARVSPDAKKIVYSVTFGSLWQHNANKSWHLGEPINSKLYLYDIASKTRTEIPNQSATVINRMPDWIDNSRIVYSSNAANLWPVRDQWNCHQGTYPDGRPRGYAGGVCVSQSYPYSASGKSMQIWRMKIDGTAQTNLTPHEAMAIRPTVLRHPSNQGRIAYSSWQVSEDKGFYGGGGAVTLVNLWWIMTMAPDGTNPSALVGAHHSGYINKNAPPGMQQVDAFMALRSVGEDTTGRLYFTNYYRANHFGLGTVYRMTPPLGNFEAEGCSTQNCYLQTVTPSGRDGTGQFIPPDLRAITPFGMGSDNQQNRDGVGRALGKAGFPAPLANGLVMATWGQGLCHLEPLSWRFDGTKASLGGQPLCDRQIVEIRVDRVVNPFDFTQMRVLAGDTKKNEWDAVEISPRPATHVQPPLDTTSGCFLEVADIRDSELYPIAPTYDWKMRAVDVGIQANTVNPYKNLHRERVKSLAIYGVQQHTTTYPNPKFMQAVNYTGYESVWYMGKQDMQSDGSVRMQVPCGQSFFMSAIGTDGKQVTRDPFLHNLRPGETKTCFGCHEGHSVERRAEIGMERQDAFSVTLASNTYPPLVNGKFIEPWDKVAQVISTRCGGCHTGFQNDNLLWSRVFADHEQLDFPWMKRMKNRNGGYTLPRPYFSGLVARYADWSMLYWVMVGKRTDGWSNADFVDDQDYPPNHPALNLTQAEIATITRYIQIGAPMPLVVK